MASGIASKSLQEVHASVSVSHPSFWKRLIAFAGPAYMVSVGYMDPGNWATDLEGGSRFGYSLLWVLLLSNMMALLLQTLSARMGIVGGRDLAQACRDLYPKIVRIPLWILCEVAIAACDLAEVIGTVIGLKLLFGLPLEWGLIVTVCDTFLLLAIQKLGIRRMEAFIVTLVFTIGACFFIEILLADPAWGAVLRGFIPSVTSTPPFVFSNIDALYIAIGILGATVMPHNLYLHSALVQSRSVEKTPDGMKTACKFNLIDSFLALNAAFLVNAAILILSAAAFHGTGQEVAGIEEAHRLLPQFLGPSVAATLFAVALLCSGQSSTLTGTLAGQIVMEGFISLRMRPWMRRLLTRGIAIIPAALTIFFVGPGSLTDLLVLSQVVLSLQLPFAIVPLLIYTSDKRMMGPFANRLWVKILGWTAAVIIISLNVNLAVSQIAEWRTILTSSGHSSLWIDLTVVPFTVLCGILLLWIVVEPFIMRRALQSDDGHASPRDIVENLTKPQYRRIAVAVENVPGDVLAISHAVSEARVHGAELVVIHVVDGVGAQWHGPETTDEEQMSDERYINELVKELAGIGVKAHAVLRHGTPAEELIKACREECVDYVILRAHGHGFIADRVFGHTIETLRHALRVPVLAVRGAD